MRFNSPHVRITLIRPSTLQLRANLSSYGALPPIGLAYVAASLRDAGHQISVIDGPGEAIDRYTELKSPIGTLVLNGLTAEEIVDRIPPETEVIGITHMFLHEWPTIRKIAELAKAKLPSVVVIVGGENATSFWKYMFRDTTAVDYCVLGEGDKTAVELIQRLQEGRPTNDMLGVASRLEGRGGLQNRSAEELTQLRTYAQQVASELPKRVQDVDDLPYPAWEYFPVEEYLRTADHFGVNRGRSMPMLATRGCPYQCTFCSSPQMWTTKYVTRSPRAVVDEMKFYIEKYRVNNINFCDLTAIVKKEWVIEFCDILKREQLNLYWQLPSGTRSESLDEEVLKKVYETGCRNITYAPESGSDRMLKIIKKKVQIPRMLESLKTAKRAGLVVRFNIIIGHPQELRSDIWKSLKFLIQCALIGCEDAAIMIFAPYPGSEDFKNLLSQGKLTVSEDYYYLPLARSGFTSRTYNPIMSTRELVVTQFLLLAVFYAIAYLTHPWRFIGLINSLITGNEQTQVDQLIRTKIQRDFAWFRAPSWLRQFMHKVFRGTVPDLIQKAK